MVSMPQKCLLLVLFANSLTSCQGQRAPDISGQWEAKGATPCLSKALLWASALSDGEVGLVFYAVNNDLTRIPVESAILRDSTLSFSIEQLNISYTGKLSTDGNSIAGVCTLGEQANALEFRRNVDVKSKTVKALELLLSAASGKSDAQIAVVLHGVRLTERLSTEHLTQLEEKLPRPEARQALIAIADNAVFLDPPEDELAPIEAPDTAALDKMLALARDYVARTVVRLPNLTAMRTTATTTVIFVLAMRGMR